MRVFALSALLKVNALKKEQLQMSALSAVSSCRFELTDKVKMEADAVCFLSWLCSLCVH